MISPRKSVQSGLSLVELMVAITLGLLLTVAAVQVFISSRGVFRMQDSVSRLQESGRFAVNALSQDVRMAGFMGCPSVDRIPINIIASNVSEYDLAPDTVIVGQDNVAAGNAWNAVAETDVVIIRKAGSGSARLAGNTSPSNANIQLANEAGVPEFAADDVLMITDCVSADIFRATNVSNSGGPQITMAHASDGNIENKLSKSYGQDAEVLQFEMVEYFVRDTGRRTPSNQPINGLYVRRLSTVQANGSLPPAADWGAYELVDGVADMQIEYGVDTNNDRMADAYESASDVANWRRVVSARLNLLMQSAESNVVGTSGAQVQNLQFMGEDLPQDGRLRQVFSTTVAVRNRLP